MSEIVQRIVYEIWSPILGDGVDGQKIAIVGYSHYLHEHDSDRPSVTRDIVQAVMDGRQKHTFFTKIKAAFEGGTHKDFWSRVYFFNFLPRSVGTKEKMYATGTEVELQEAQARFLRFIEKEQPDKVFVFTRKGWKHFPASVEESGNNVCTVLLEGSKTNWGTYEVGSKMVKVCGFQHPQYADREQLGREVQFFLNM